MEQSTLSDVERELEGYAPPSEDKPLVGYTLLMSIFNAFFAGAVLASSDRLPERASIGDLTLLTVATHKLSRIIAKDKVTSPVRAPFARFEEDAGPSEVSETARGSGLRK